MIRNQNLYRRQRSAVYNEHKDRTLNIVKTVAQNANGVVICHYKNGRALLPHFLKHYREMGVKEFIFIDNASVDNSVDYLKLQSDCTIYSTSQDFNSSACGTTWVNYIISQHQYCDWILRVDIDEFYTYWGWPEKKIDTFVQTCWENNISTVNSIMIDFYGREPIASAMSYDESINLLEDFPYFDGHSYYENDNRNWRVNKFPRKILGGGPTERSFGRSGTPWLTKTPLILEPNIYFLDPHTVIPVSLNFGPIYSVLVHFRFTRDVLRKCKAVSESGYSQGSINEYDLLAKEIDKNQCFTFFHSESSRFESVKSFVDLGIMMMI